MKYVSVRQQSYFLGGIFKPEYAVSMVYQTHGNTVYLFGDNFLFSAKINKVTINLPHKQKRHFTFTHSQHKYTQSTIQIPICRYKYESWVGIRILLEVTIWFSFYWLDIMYQHIPYSILLECLCIAMLLSILKYNTKCRCHSAHPTYPKF